MLWKLTRVPEPEVMDDSGEVESYNSGAATRHLDEIDNTFVEHLLRLLPNRPISPNEGTKGTASNERTEKAASPATRSFQYGLDVGTGPGQIPVKILARLPKLRYVGLDRSPNMLVQARQNAESAGVAGRLQCLVADGHALPFPDHFFSIVTCNSVLHHARAPVELLREIFRVASPTAPILIRDLRRPARPLLAWHLWRHGHYYGGLMRHLFNDSVRAAYTLEELQEFLDQTRAPDARVFRFRGAHIGIERAAVGEVRLSLQDQRHSVR
jgi:ubiquinone/menaquinone biosynthesis C-methylase UbiE